MLCRFGERIKAGGEEDGWEAVAVDAGDELRRLGDDDVAPALGVLAAGLLQAEGHLRGLVGYVGVEGGRARIRNRLGGRIVLHLQGARCRASEHAPRRQRSPGRF